MLRERPSSLGVVADLAASWISRTEESLDTKVHFSARPPGDATPLQIAASPPAGTTLPAAIFPLVPESAEEEADAEVRGQHQTLLTPNSARLLAEKGEALLRLLETGNPVRSSSEGLKAWPPQSHLLIDR